MQRPAPILWLTGLSGSGKSTLARALFAHLQAQSLAVELLDADNLRRHLSKGLGFTREDREENVRRIGFVAALLSRHGVLPIVAAMSPYRSTRDEIRAANPHLLEVFVDAPIAVCETRDPVGLYRRFRAGEIRDLSGLDAPYEPPLSPALHLCTGEETADQSLARILGLLAPYL